MHLEPLRAYDELVDASGGDAFVRWMVDPARAVRGWRLGAGVGWVRTGPSGRRSLTLVTTPDDAAQALPLLIPELPDVTSATLPRGTLDLVDPAAVPGLDPSSGDDWEWMLTDAAPPPQRSEHRVRVLGQSDADDVRALLEAASPRHSAEVGAPEVVGWYGVRDDEGRLVACAAHTEPVRGVPHLASIATHPSARGQGLGAAVTAAVTRAPLAAGRAVVTLGMYSDNAVARRLYHRLGYTCDHRWSSRRLRRTPS